MLTSLSQLVIDAGPLIALLYAKDPQHAECRNGFEQLTQAKVRVYIPIPILFEVYKWLLHTTNPTTAQASLNIMVESLHLIPTCVYKIGREVSTSVLYLQRGYWDERLYFPAC